MGHVRSRGRGHGHGRGRGRCRLCGLNYEFSNTGIGGASGGRAVKVAGEVVVVVWVVVANWAVKVADGVDVVVKVAGGADVAVAVADVV